MNVSVIIPTYNGAHKLPSIIRSISTQSYQPTEVIIVVDGSTDNSLEVLASLKVDYPFLKFISQENKGRAVVRNRGAEEALGPLLIFFDDDMIPEENCIKMHVEHHQQYLNSILTGGIQEYSIQGSTEIEKFKSFLSTKWLNPLKGRLGKQLDREHLFITAANFSINRNLFRSLGGFDESFNDAEDFDLAVRAFKARIPLYFNYNAFAWHNEKVTCATYIKRQRQYNQAHSYLLTVKPWMQQEEYIKKAVHPSGLKRKLFQLFTYPFWVRATDLGLFKVLPKGLRYKLYDLIITSNGVYFPDKLKL